MKRQYIDLENDTEVKKRLEDLAETAHKAIGNVASTGYNKKIAEAHKLIHDKLLELSKDLVLH